MPAVEHPNGFIVMCVHSTRRTRRDATSGASETRCCGCGATILLHHLSTEHARRQGVPIYPVCPSCAGAVAEPDALVADTFVVPGTAELLEREDGCEDGAAYVASQGSLTVREFAADALRRTVGGQG